MKEEERLQQAVSDYIRYQYPSVIFFCDYAAGLHLPIHLAKRAKRLRSHRGLPDLFIAEPKKEIHGLFIEFKIQGVKLFKKNGQYASPHIAEQAMMMHKLSAKNYAVAFACGFDESKKIIDGYLTVKK